VGAYVTLRNLFAGAFASVVTFAYAAATSAVSMKSKPAEVGASLTGAARRLLVLTSIIGLPFGFSGPAKAITINPGDTITVSLSGLPGSTMYIGFGYGLTFAAPDFFPANGTMRSNVFDAGNSLLGQRTDGPFGITIGGIISDVFGSTDNTGHLVFDQFSASFVLESLSIAGIIDDGNGGFHGTDDVSPQFVVTTASPIPAALPLFASGLGALGFIGWRRKRKASWSSAIAA
jgi:hypothetical protein